MSAPWPTRKLREIADIRVSNVDKQSHPSEEPVRLCNYMDVYANDYVTGQIDFMEATATKGEIERFGLKSGDVVITKDSETPDDIGIPAVITETAPNLVCGYHLALIRPKPELLDPIYLAKQLATSEVTKYFALNASGSTRYGLPIGAIESVEIPTPPKPEQTKIAEILSTVDRAIEQTEALIAKQQRLKTGLMQDLLTRGIDEHGRIRSEETHEFKDSPLGRIPVEWEESTLGEEIGTIISGWSPTCEREPAAMGEWGVLKTTACVWDGYDETENKRLPEDLRPVRKAEVVKNDILITRKGPMDRVGVVVHVHETRPQLMVPDTVFKTRILEDSEMLPEFLPMALGSTPVQRGWSQKKIGLAEAQVNLNHSILRETPIFCPSKDEQIRILETLFSARMISETEFDSLSKLRTLKTALMQDLLTGRKRVTDLLDRKEATR